MIRTLEYHLHDLVPYVNWIYFFHAWGLPSHFSSVAKVHSCPACQQTWMESFSAGNREKAAEGLNLYKNAVGMLRQLDGQYLVRARFGLFPAWSEEDDVVVGLSPEDLQELRGDDYLVKESDRQCVLHFLRQQHEDVGTPCLCLSDFIVPKSIREQRASLWSDENSLQERGYALGVFVAAVDAAMEELYPEDNYKKMLLQTLCDRLAEAAAEKMHEEVRKSYWAYAPDEHFTEEELFSEKYEGKRPAVGYPSIPDQSFNFDVDRLINMGRIGVSLTENGMMMPHASVSGLMLDHPAARHFSVGTIGEDQLRNYAERKGCDINYCRKFLAANLSKNS